MIATPGSKDVYAPAWEGLQPAEDRRLFALKFLALNSLLVMSILLPVQFLELPLNLALVDFWNALALPLCWLYLAQTRQTIRLPYLGAMWLILLGSFTGALSASDPVASLAVVLKEVYLYVWFVTLVAFFATLTTRELRRLLLMWLIVELLHGSLIVAQFLSPDVFHFTAVYFGRYGTLDVFRPSGLFTNANGAAFFQLTGFVPLVLLGRSKRLTSILGVGLLLSIIATGSLGATAGFVGGVLIALAAIAVIDGRPSNLIRLSVQLIAVAALLGGLAYVVIRSSPYLQARLQYTFYGRAERSADSRFGIWQSGIDVLVSDMPIWGLGPGNFRDEGSGKTLHNDLLAFTVERGVLGVLGLGLLGLTTLSSTIRLLQPYRKRPTQAWPLVVIFLAALISTLIESQTHQVFHERSLWLILALQEAALLKTMLFGQTEAPASPLDGSPTRPAFQARTESA